MTTLPINERITTAIRVLENIAQGMSPTEIAAQWPELTPADAQAALEYALEYALTMVRQLSTDAEDSHEPPELCMHKILVVDDQPLNCRLVQQILKNSEFTLSFASNGQEGLEKALAERPFLVLSDIMMPVMDGFEMCEKLKADERTKDAAVIFITAHHRDATMVSKGLDMGADDYIYRPFQPSELEARVRAVARLKRAEMQARQRAKTVARRNDELEFLNRLTLAATSSRGLQEIFVPSMPKLAQLLGADAVALLLLDKAQQAHVNITTRAGKFLSTSADLVCDLAGENITLQTILEQAPLVLTEILDNSKANLDIAPLFQSSTISTVPMISQDQIIGAMGIIHAEGDTLLTKDMMLLNSVAGIMTVADENARLFATVQAFNRHLEQMVKERTRQLIEEKQKTEAILASMADGLLVLDAQDRILTANRTAEEMLGFCLNQLQGESIGEEQLDSPLWRCVSDMSTSREPTMSRLVELPGTAQPDSAISIQAHSAKVRDESGERPEQTIGTVILLRDISALKEVERLKARFMAGVTHELKTPLAVIRVHANNLLTYYERLPEQKHKDLLGAIQNQVALLGQLIEGILDLARLDAGAMKIEREPVDLGALVEKAVTAMRPLAESKRIATRWEKPSAAVMTMADPRILDQVIRNLVDNAIKYTPDEGLVEIQTLSTMSEGCPTVEIRVKDSGVGIAPEHQERIFERFYRVDSSHTIPGAGLGLAIVKEIVEAHGGAIEVQSSPQAGSTFLVTLSGIPKED